VYLLRNIYLPPHFLWPQVDGERANKACQWQVNFCQFDSRSVSMQTMQWITRRRGVAGKGGGGRITGSIEQRADISMVIWGQNGIVFVGMYMTWW